MFFGDTKIQYQQLHDASSYMRYPKKPSGLQDQRKGTKKEESQKNTIYSSYMKSNFGANFYQSKTDKKTKIKTYLFEKLL